MIIKMVELNILSGFFFTLGFETRKLGATKQCTGLTFDRDQGSLLVSLGTHVVPGTEPRSAAFNVRALPAGPLL